jgi:hypothetical protein
LRKIDRKKERNTIKIENQVEEINTIKLAKLQEQTNFSSFHSEPHIKIKTISTQTGIRKRKTLIK